MLQKWVFLFFASCSCLASAQIYECKDAKGGRLWTNEPCADGKVLHEGVDRASQHRALEADRLQRSQRARDDAQAAYRFRQNAYAPQGYSSPSHKSLERCDTTRRSLRIEYSKILEHRNAERIRQLRSDEWKYC